MPQEFGCFHVTHRWLIPFRTEKQHQTWSCKMSSKNGLSRFHVNLSVLLLILTLLKQAEFCSSTRTIQKQPTSQPDVQSHNVMISELPVRVSVNIGAFQQGS